MENNRARLSDINRSKSVKGVGGNRDLLFPLPPETIRTSVKGTYASNNVLDRDNPFLRRKYSETTYSLGRILLISHGFKTDYSGVIDTLKTWAKQQTKLAFDYNTFSIKICYIDKLEVEVKLWKNGKPVHVEVTIDLLEGSPDVVSIDKEVVKKKAVSKGITPREQLKVKAKVQKKLDVPAKKAKLGIVGKTDIKVSSLSQVTIAYEGGEKTYAYEDFEAQTA